ncbi:MAG: phage transcriptional regulator [Frankiales bacterium]|nr:phage transcriptional regulator [Frankiales bacterium]
MIVVDGGEAADRAACRRWVLQMSSGAHGELHDLTFMTVAEVAAIMRVSKMTVYRLVHSGELPSVRVGRSFRVPARAVNEYLRGAFDSTG